MNESDLRREVRNMLRYRYNLWPDHFPDYAGIKEESGRPDIVVHNPFGGGVYIEMKCLDVSKHTSFAFSEISEKQRQWLTDWETVRPNGSYLGLGTVGTRERTMYIIPWNDWLMIELEVSNYGQQSLPYIVKPGMLKVLQDNLVDFRLLKPWELVLIPAARRVPKQCKWRFNSIQEEVWRQILQHHAPPPMKF